MKKYTFKVEFDPQLITVNGQRNKKKAIEEVRYIIGMSAYTIINNASISEIKKKVK